MENQSASEVNPRRTERANAGVPPQMFGYTPPGVGRGRGMTPTKGQKAPGRSSKSSASVASNASLRTRHVAADLAAAEAEMEARLKVIQLPREFAHAELDEE